MMKKTAYPVLLVMAFASTGAQAQSGSETSGNEGHFYLGVGASALALDNDRVRDVPTSSPSHSSKLANFLAGYQFNDQWAAEARFGTEFDNLDVDVLAVNGYRFFGSGNWRPFLSAGLSNFSLDERALDDDTDQAQVGVGFSGNLNRNLELRVGYQSFFTLSGDSYQDNEFSAVLAWHFRKPEVVAVSEPEPEPEPAPAEREVIETYELQVLFDFDKSAIKSAYEPQFQEIAQVLEDNPEIDLRVEGHTCWIGTERYNEGLSQRRADAVKQKFVDEYGIDPARIETIGYGESRPIADNTTLEGRRRNRRAIAVTLGPENVDQ